MKKTLFVALVATVALLATSCKKAEAPKASFSYENDGLEVSFTNLSKNADTYAWDFGDGQTSTETNPKHTYAAYGDFTVTLKATGKGGDANYAETISLTLPSIKIDGDFADWDAVVAAGTAAYTELKNDGTEYASTALKSFAAYMDADFIYFMIEAKSDKNEVMPLDMYFGLSGEVEDASPCTHLWTPMYCDYLCEFGKGDTFVEDPTLMDWYDWTYNTLFLFDHDKGGWSFSQVNQGVCTVSNKVVSGDYFKLEGSLPRAAMTVDAPAAYVYISCNVSNADWGESGQAPAAIVVEGTTEYQPQLKLIQGDLDK